jgi:hypothetical protein
VDSAGERDPRPIKIIRGADFDTRIYFEKRFARYGVVRVQEWPEGLVICVGGEIVYGTADRDE